MKTVEGPLGERVVYLGTLWTLLRANWGSVRFFSGALDIFPKAEYFAYLMVAKGVSHVHMSTSPAISLQRLL